MCLAAGSLFAAQQYTTQSSGLQLTNLPSVKQFTVLWTVKHDTELAQLRDLCPFIIADKWM